MKRPLVFLGGLALVLIAVFSLSRPNSVEGRPSFASFRLFKGSHRQVCGSVAGGQVRCNARVMVDSNGKPQASSTLPAGYGPLQFLTAYSLTATTSANKTIGIVDAYDDPNILSDLNNYSSTFGIPSLNSCPVSSGTPNSPCFQKVSQTGGSSYPSVNSGWALEISLDVQAAHAICQNCNILLVEASSSSFTNLMAAVDRARIMGANVISNSYGASEFSTETSYDSHFNYSGIVFTFSSGDSGYGTSYPAASRYVTAVGGTTLNLSGNSYLSESVWSGAGSGCSLYESKPSFQIDTGCTMRTIADVSADADPNTGAAVYDTVPYYGSSGWFQVGGTSLSSPLIAATYALAGGFASTTMGNSVPYSLYNYSTNLHDVVTGKNGSCSSAYLCTGVVGYDGPTGLGTPNGTSAFGSAGATPTPTPIPTPSPTPSPSPTATPTPTPTPTATPTPTPTPQPVSVTITYPKNGSYVSRNTTITITTKTSSNVTKVNFTVNSSLTCSVTSAPFSCKWTVPGIRSARYTITAKAQDALGDTASNSVGVTAR